MQAEAKISPNMPQYDNISEDLTNVMEEPATIQRERKDLYHPTSPNGVPDLRSQQWVFLLPGALRDAERARIDRDTWRIVNGMSKWLVRTKPGTATVRSHSVLATRCPGLSARIVKSIVRYMQRRCYTHAFLWWKSEQNMNLSPPSFGLKRGGSFNLLNCFYSSGRFCDFRIYAFNDRLFSFGWRHARFLKVWFAIGVAFSFVALIGSIMILLWELAGNFHLGREISVHDHRSVNWLFGTTSLVPGLSLSVMDTVIIVFSTLFSVAIHELGHAIAAASTGLQIEYIAVFLAIIFPGALVAFNYDVLQSLPRFSMLRIYCAGIWLNAVEESCMKPVLIPSMSWVEVSYSSPYTPQCSKPNEKMATAEL
ncbi:uncharacterized protein LOC120258690 [Dioscorea cayenensis subsp. rotundata]|uniref:Endopeptidase S2P n=1 Tax=Dioscorea cayennensis subsp. rotundata TaxID=55577 RepID=A0AB40B484_DIOCR|nr:uncharacterized protein LOC120258690 [Dioscorea cayenensis subsp. rotundata]